MRLDYTPPPTIRDFMLSDRRVRVIRGPVGSAKSTGMAMELFRRAAEQTPDPHDGIRRSRAVIVRNTLPQLKTTCLETVLNLFKGACYYRPSDNVIQFRLGDIHSDWILLPLDTPQNIQRLLSLEISFAWVSECREIPPTMIQDILSRCGRFPSKLNGGCVWRGVVAESNSFRKDSPWYELLEQGLPENWQYFIQPGAFDPGAENVENLPPAYYEELLASNSEEWSEMYIHNRYGEALDGQAVYRNSFKREFHVASGPLTPTPHRPLIIGMDFARWPAAVLCQMDARGRFVVFAELDEENTGVERFVTTYLLPLLRSERFQGIPCYVVGDPSGTSRSQIGEESVFDALKRLGLHAYPAQTNAIDPRIRAVEKYLYQQRDGGPALLVDPGCVKLIAGFMSKYRYRMKKTGEYENQPDKVRPWADLHDALQYGCLGTSQNIMSHAIGALQSRSDERIQPVPVGAWT